jgi:teichuronic acid biosynthesis glycosyltransferase TuaC
MARDESVRRSRGVKNRDLLTWERKDPRSDVLVVTNGWPNEDNDTYCVFIKRQTASLIDRGLRCDVLFIRGYRSPLAYLIAAGRLASLSLARKPKYKLVHAHSGEAALAASLYRRSRLLFSYLGDDLLGTPDSTGRVSLTGRARRIIFRQHSRLADRTITKSQQMWAVLPSTVRSRTTVLPNGVDRDLFRPADRTEARLELGWNADDRVILFAADPSIPRKRYWLAQASVERARSLLPDLRLEVARGITPTRMPLIMNAADCLLLTSSIEGSPNVVKEALMCNLPVVATHAGDVKELLDGVTPSYVCDASDRALSKCLVECLREPRRSNGRDRSRQLDARVVADSLLNLYRELVPDLDVETETAEARIDNRAKTGAA